MSVINEARITTRGAMNFRKSDMRRAGRNGMQALGREHHRQYKPRKFGRNATQVYRLRRRSGKYRRAKRGRGVNGQGIRAIGDDSPFVWSQATRDAVMQSRRVIARAPTGARHFCLVVLNARQLNRLRWLSEEMQRVNKNELRRLRRVGTIALEKTLQRSGRVVNRRT